MPERSADKPTVLITGAAKRIGRAIALDLAQHGWRVAVHFNTSGDAAARTVQEITSAGGAAVAIEADLADLRAAQGLIGACLEQIGQPTCLINNASAFEHDEFASLTGESWQDHIDINLRAPVFLAQTFAANLAPPAEGTIINIVDQRVWKLTPNYFSYTISKAGLWAATQTMAQALAPRIRVNAIGPGPTLANTRQSEAAFVKQQQATPLGRGADLREIGAAVRFILDAPSMTGQMIALDGGQHLAWQTPDETEADD